MDQYLQSTEIVEETEQFAWHLVRFLHCGSFDLTKFMGNVLESVADIHRNTEYKEIKISARHVETSHVFVLE